MWIRDTGCYTWSQVQHAPHSHNFPSSGLHDQKPKMAKLDADGPRVALAVDSFSFLARLLTLPRALHLPSSGLASSLHNFAAALLNLSTSALKNHVISKLPNRPQDSKCTHINKFKFLP
jgi:hypothetical protein